MHRAFLLSILAALAALPLAFAQTDADGKKDYPGLSRMPGYYIRSCDESQFDSYKFKVKQGNQEKELEVEGHRWDYRYDMKDGATMASALQIVRNFQNAVRAAGGQVLFEAGEGGERETTLRFQKGTKEVWAWVRAISGVDKLYFLTVVEKEAMQQDVTLDAKGMARDIGESGRVALYGIYFDTGKSELKPESAPALAEIGKLMAQNPVLRVCVVGHTDMVADFTTNAKLSQARAQAVVAALVSQYGIANSRLVPIGIGPYAPVGSNRTEEGRAKNRRVELVEIAAK